MIELKTLGRLGIAGAEDESAGVLKQAKTVVLLAYVGLESRLAPVPVPQVCAMFWADVDLSQARASLRSALLAARRAGLDVIERVQPDHLTIPADRLQVDAATLLDSTPSADWLLDHCHGDFLAGLATNAGRELEEWLDATRDTLRRRAVELLLEHVATAPPGLRLRLLERALELDPYNEPAAVQMVHALGGLRGRAAAWLFFEDFRNRCARDLDLPPAPVLTRAVLEVCGEDATSAETPRFVRHHAAWQRVRRPTAVRAALFLSVLLGGTIGVLSWVRPDRAAGADDRNVVAHIELGSDSGSALWRSTVVPDLAARLAERGMSLVTNDGAGVLRLSGDATLDSSHVSGMVRLEDAATGRLLHTWRLRATSPDLASVLAAIGDSVRASVGSELARRSISGSLRAPAAVDAMIRARKALDEGRAANARAAAGVAALHFAQADSLSQVAARLERDWERPHLLRTEALEQEAARRYAVGDRAAVDTLLAQALRSATHAVDLGGGAPALERRGGLNYLSWIFGRQPSAPFHDAALRDITAAVKGDAGSAHAWITLATLHAGEGRFADADAAARAALERDAFGRYAENILLQLFGIAFHRGRMDEAGAWCDELMRRSPGQGHAVECMITRTFASGAAGVATLDTIDMSLPGNSAPMARLMTPLMELTRAAAYASNGSHMKARAIYRAVDRTGAHPDLPLYEARVLAQLGELDQAVTVLGQWASVPGRPARAGAVWHRWFEPLHRRAGSADAFARSFESAIRDSTRHRR